MIRKVCGSHGDLLIESDGTPLGFIPEGYADIMRFDVDEYFQFWTLDDPKRYCEFDILDLGYWNADGTYEPPAHDWREEVKIQMLHHNVMR